MQYINYQDRLLEILRRLHKYDKFRMYWDQFIMNPDPMRISDLLAIHAEYKIHLKEMAIARHMLLKALSINKNNEIAQNLLQVRNLLMIKIFNSAIAHYFFFIINFTHNSSNIRIVFDYLFLNNSFFLKKMFNMSY